MANKKSSTKTTTKVKTTSKKVGEKKPIVNNKIIDKELLDLADKKTSEMDKNDIKEKVDLLTADLDEITSEKTKKNEDVKKDKTTTKSKQVGNEWLEEQIEGLTAEVAKYERKYLEMKSDYEKLFQSSVNNSNDVNVNNKIIQLYRELLDNYNGNNSLGKRWENVKIEYLLNKLRNNFDFIK